MIQGGTPYDLGNLLLCLRIGVEYMAVKWPFVGKMMMTGAKGTHGYQICKA